jgi:hypothetical protein
MKHLKRWVVTLLLSLVSFPLAKISHATCSTYENPVGPYAESSCFEDNDCDDHGEDLMCQEWDCSNCLNQQTGYTQLCVNSYDCGLFDSCSNVVCT